MPSISSTEEGEEEEEERGDGAAVALLYFSHALVTDDCSGFAVLSLRTFETKP